MAAFVLGIAVRKRAANKTQRCQAPHRAALQSQQPNQLVEPLLCCVLQALSSLRQDLALVAQGRGTQALKDVLCSEHHLHGTASQEGKLKLQR